MPDFTNRKTVFSKKNITFAYIFFNLLYVTKPKNQKTKKPKNLRKFIYIFLILFAVFQACKPKYQEEIKPESLPKHNKTGVLTAKKWWKNQKANAQNLQQKGGEPNFEDVFVPDWTNAESRTSQKGKLQIRVPLLQNDSLHTPIFIPFTDEKGVKHFGTIELLLQANPDSTFQKLYNTIGTTDSTNRFDVQKNNFFRKEDNFEGKVMFFNPETKKANLIQEFSKDSRIDYYTVSVRLLAGICATVKYTKNDTGEIVILNITYYGCPEEGGGNPTGSTTYVQYFSNAGWQWVQPNFATGNGGSGVDVTVSTDPFEPPSEYEFDDSDPTVQDDINLISLVKRDKKTNKLMGNFNPDQWKKISDALKEVCAAEPYLKKLYFYLKSTNTQMEWRINEGNVVGGWMQTRVDSSLISIIINKDVFLDKNKDQLKIALFEELLHAGQAVKYGYVAYNGASASNLEFEAKFILEYLKEKNSSLFNSSAESNTNTGLYNKKADYDAFKSYLQPLNATLLTSQTFPNTQYWTFANKFRQGYATTFSPAHPYAKPIVQTFLPNFLKFLFLP